MEPKPQENILQFHYLCSAIDAAYHEASQKLGLSDSAMMILYTLCRSSGSCLLHDITRLSGIQKQTIHSALRHLQREGIVSLENTGGRQKKVCLTEQGKQVAEKTALRLIQIESAIFDAWDPEEWQQYLLLTQRYLADFRAKRKEILG